MAYSRQAGGGKLEDQEAWLKERFFQHRDNAEVVRQDLVREQGIDVSLRTVERAVAPFRRLLTAEAKATVRFETPPGRQLQVDFGQRRVPIGDERVRVFLFVATLGYSRRCYVAAFRHERQSSWFRGFEGAFHHFGGVTREVLIDNPRPLVVIHDGETREVEFNDRFLAFAAYWGFRARVCAPYRARTKGKDERGVNLFRPGVGAALGDAAGSGEMPELDTPTSGVDLLLGIVPTNVLSSAAAGDMLPIIFFSIVLGTAIANVKADDARGTLVGFFNAFFQRRRNGGAASANPGRARRSSRGQHRGSRSRSGPRITRCSTSVPMIATTAMSGDSSRSILGAFWGASGTRSGGESGADCDRGCGRCSRRWVWRFARGAAMRRCQWRPVASLSHTDCGRGRWLRSRRFRSLPLGLNRTGPAREGASPPSSSAWSGMNLAALIEAVPQFTGPVPTRLREVRAEVVCRLWPARVSRAARATPPDRHAVDGTPGGGEG